MGSEPEEIRASVAFQMLARQHSGLNVIARILGDDSEPARAWIECDGCAAVFEFRDLGHWVLIEEEPVFEIDPDCGRHHGAVQV